MASPAPESEMKLSFEEYHEFKLPSEVDPLKKEGKGGFLEGEIQLPKVVPESDLRVTISTHPTLSRAFLPNKVEKYPEVKKFSPCLIYPFQKTKGNILWNKMPRPYLQHWKLELLIKGNTVYLKKNSSELDTSRDTIKQEQEWTEISEIGSDRKLHFGKDIKKNIKEGITQDIRKVKVKILYPKSEARSSEGEVTVKEMLRQRGCPPDFIEDIALEFSGKTNRRRLNECKLRVDLQVQDGGCWTGLSEPIRDSKCQLKMYYRTPNFSCSLGGTNVAMLSESSVDKNDVVPQFQLWSTETGEQIEEEVETRLLNNQIEEVTVRNGWLLFSTPPQPHLGEILSKGYEFKLVATRISDGAVSNAFDFNFRFHDSCLHTIRANLAACSDCHFSKECLPEIVKAMPGKRKLGKERTPEEEGESDRSCRMKVSKMMSPDSGVGDSPLRARRQSAYSIRDPPAGRRESNDSIDDSPFEGVLTGGSGPEVEELERTILADELIGGDTSTLDPEAIQHDLMKLIDSIPDNEQFDGAVPKSSQASANKSSSAVKPKSRRPKDARPEEMQGVLQTTLTTTKNFVVGVLVTIMLILLKLAGQPTRKGDLEVVFRKLVTVFSPFPIILAFLWFFQFDWISNLCSKQKISTLLLNVFLALILTVMLLRVLKR